MKITVLMENTALDASLCSEHGLSVHIDYEGHSILLDAGSSGNFARNARALGVDLAGWSWWCCPTDIMTMPTVCVSFFRKMITPRSGCGLRLGESTSA